MSTVVSIFGTALPGRFRGHVPRGTRYHEAVNPQRSSSRRRWSGAAGAMLLVAGVAVAGPAGDPELQLDTVRAEIARLESRLSTLTQQEEGVRARRVELEAELELAEARVREEELVLAASRAEILRLQEASRALGDELAARRDDLRHHLAMVALLGRPGALQLLDDAVRGGDLDRSVALVSALTTGQIRLVDEYDRLLRQRSARLAELSRVMEQARTEAERLAARRRELETVRSRVERQLEQLEASRRRAGSRLEDMRQRAEALARLMGRLAERDRLTGSEDIRGFKGALPWPVSGEVVRTFGRHFLPRYSTYTVNNGIWLEVESQAEVRCVFPGMVAFAGHFKGYGNMVVIDHGHDVYTLAAGLATIHVRLDQQLTMGARLGLASPPDDDDGNVYFEVRGANGPEDPTRWLQLREGQTR